jgi:hypothetical protein
MSRAMKIFFTKNFIRNIVKFFLELVLLSALFLRLRSDKKNNRVRRVGLLLSVAQLDIRQ